MFSASLAFSNLHILVRTYDQAFDFFIAFFVPVAGVAIFSIWDFLGSQNILVFQKFFGQFVKAERHNG